MFHLVNKATVRYRVVLLLAIGSLVGLSGLVSAQVPNAAFVAGRIEYPFDPGLLGIVQADFNGDMKMDIAVVNSSLNTISLLLSNASGGFNPRTITVPEDRLARAQFLAAADFDGDNKLDLAVTSAEPNPEQNNVVILKGDGNGGFTYLTAFKAGVSARFIMAYDFDQDGQMDVAVCDAGSSNLQVVLRRPDGTFAAPVNYPVDDGGNPRFIAMGDYDGDGVQDLAITVVNKRPDVSDKVLILFGNSNGTFTRRSQIVLPVGSRPEGIARGDFNQDGIPDLAVATVGDRKLYVFHGRSSVRGTFSLRSVIGAAEGLNVTTGSVIAGDFNGDGLPDLAVGTVDKMTVLLGNSRGLFELSRLASYYSGGFEPNAVAVADFNGDTNLDLAVSNFQSGNVTMLFGNGDGTFDLLHRVGNRTWTVTTGDFNHDGILDLAAANRDSSEIAVLFGNGESGFHPPGYYPTGSGVGPEAIATADFDGDGNLDLVTVNYETNNITVFMGDSKGGFSLPRNYPLLDEGDLRPKAVLIDDFNGDGFLDLAIPKTGQNSRLTIFPGNGRGDFIGPLTYFLDGSGAIAVTAGDFNRDGFSDLATANQFSHSVSVLLRDSASMGRTFLPVVTYSVREPDVREQPSAIVSGDFDGDGCLDLAVGYWASPVVSILRGEKVGENCTGRFLLPPRDFATRIAGHAGIIAADLNGDQKLDLAVIHNDNHTLSVLLNQGDGTFNLQYGRFGVGLNPTGLIAVDINGDQKMDLAAAGSGSGDFIILLNNTP